MDAPPSAYAYYKPLSLQIPYGMHGKTPDYSERGQGLVRGGKFFSHARCKTNQPYPILLSYMLFRSEDLVLDLVIPPPSVVDPSPRFSLNLQLGGRPLQRHLTKTRQDNAELCRALYPAAALTAKARRVRGRDRLLEA